MAARLGAMIEDLRHFRQDRPTMVRVAVTLWITFFVLAPITAASVASLNAAPQAPSSSSRTAGTPLPATPAEAATISVEDMARFVTACMNRSARLDWTDPHDGMKHALFCNNYAFPVAK